MTIKVRDSAGSDIPNVHTIVLAGLGAAVRSVGPGKAEIDFRSGVDPKVSAVLTGGDWKVRETLLSGVAINDYTLRFAGGTGVVAGRDVRWSHFEIETPAENSVVFIDANGRPQVRAVGSPEQLPTQPELHLARSFVDIATFGEGIYSVHEARTYVRSSPRASFNALRRIQNSVVPSGTYAAAVRVNDVPGAKINWYFANLGLLPFVQALPAIVQAHLDLQVSLFYAFGGGTNAAFSAANYATINTTPQYTAVWSDASWINWPYDILDPTGTPQRVRADSHDSTVATFVLLAVQYAKSSSAGLDWWNANYNAIKQAMYCNIWTRQRAVNGGAGYLQETFQDPAMYPFCQTMDGVECYAALRSAFALMSSNGGAQAADAAFFGGTATNLLLGLQSMWKTTPNATGDTEWWSVRQDTSTDTSAANELTSWYPELLVHAFALLYDIPLHGTPSIAASRLTHACNHFDRAPLFWCTRTYSEFPLSLAAFAFTRHGHRAIGEAQLDHVQCHQAFDSTGDLQLQDLGMLHGIERELTGNPVSF